MQLFFILILSLAAFMLVVQSYVRCLYFFSFSFSFLLLIFPGLNGKYQTSQGQNNSWQCLSYNPLQQTSTFIFFFVAQNSTENFSTTSFCFYKKIGVIYRRCTQKSLVIFSTCAFASSGALRAYDLPAPCYTFPTLGTGWFQQC